MLATDTPQTLATFATKEACVQDLARLVAPRLAEFQRSQGKPWGPSAVRHTATSLEWDAATFGPTTTSAIFCTRPATDE
jgi:hypothetical protein